MPVISILFPLIIFLTDSHVIILDYDYCLFTFANTSYFLEPGPPSDVQTDAFGEYILVTWKPPKEPNGIITNYQVGSAEYNGSLPEIVPFSMETVGRNVFKKLLGNKKSEKSYVVEVRAETSKGWGKSAKTTTRTIKRAGECTV